MDTKYVVLAGAVVVVGIVAVLGLSRPATIIDATKVDVNAIAQAVLDNVQSNLGAAGPLHTELQEFEGGVKYGNTVASSSLTTATVVAAEFAQWVKADVVILNPTGAAGAKTLTFPASSTIPSVLPQAGDMTKTCFYNATTSAATPVIFAGGTGVSLSVASSSATALGSTRVDAGEFGCFTFVRESALAATFDIEALYTAFK